jgi:chorismatase
MSRNEIDCSFQLADHEWTVPGDRHILGRVRFGEAHTAPALRDGVPEIGLHMASPGFDSFTEVWTTGSAAQGGEYRGLIYAHEGEYLFCAGSIPSSGTYRGRTRNAYEAAFALMDELGYRHVFRMWNFIGGINSDNAEGLEIYRDFCFGRAEAFEAKPDRVHCMPAATGIGSRGSGVDFFFLATRTGRPQNIENRHQIPAYTYPRQYGPKSPSFARATRLVTVGGNHEHGAVYVSGTASITGHETRHTGDIVAQCELSLRNISHLLSPGNLKLQGLGGGHELKDLRWVKAYVRHEEHLPVVRAACEQAFPYETHVVFLNVDVCRADLLVEIEGIVPATVLTTEVPAVLSDVPSLSRKGRPTVINTNPALPELGIHPFPRIAALLDGVAPASGHTPLDLTIGEPRFAPPSWLGRALGSRQDLLGTYPPNQGPEWFRRAAADWLETRFGLPQGTVAMDAVFPTSGAREALFQLGLLADTTDSSRRLLAMPTPHYAPYRAAAALCGLQAFNLPAVAEHGYLPDLDLIDEDRGPRTAMLILCTPSNPEGAVAPAGYLRRAIVLARTYGFILAVDECYSEIYLGDAPTGALQVCWQMHDGQGDPFRNVLVVNSLSKRSSAAGLRTGIVAGDRALVAAFIALRSYIGGTTPLPNLAAAAELLSDETHVKAVRESYREAFAAADRVLTGVPGYRKPEAGMFLWLRVRDDEEAAVRAWQHAAVRSVPGSYLGPAGWDGVHPGKEHLRLAMVHGAPDTAAALTRLVPVLHEVGVASA